MNTLWPLGEASVREIRDRLAEHRPRAYTTIMTIMDRLARKGIVTRRKVSRAYLYRPILSAEEARAHALDQVVEGFFGGSEDAMLRELAGGANAPRARAAAASAARMGPSVAADSGRPLASHTPVASDAGIARAPARRPAAETGDASRIDETLL